MPHWNAFLLAAVVGLTGPGLALAQSETATPEAESEMADDAPEMIEADADTVLATVNGTDITVGHIMVAMRELSAEEQRLEPGVLLQGLTERLLQQEALSAGVTEMSKPTQLRLDNDRRAVLASDRVQQMAATLDVTDEELQAVYDRRFADFTPATEYNASHILVETEDEAKEIVTALEGGADFAEQAKEKSTGPSGPGGGSLGWFAAGRMVPAFQEAVNALEVGAISAPVQTEFGWHVIKLNETRVPEVPTLESMRAELRGEALREKLFGQIDEIVNAATIERTDLTTIDPSVLLQPGLLVE